MDTARAVAIAGVVGGHWLVTGLVLDAEGAWRQASPLTTWPALAPVSWVLQTLGLFFFAGGFAAARSGRLPRIGRLARPVLLLVAAWAVVLTAAWLLGAPTRTLRTVATLVVSPLWFLLPYVVLHVATPWLRRHGPFVVAVPAVLVVAASDAHVVPSWLAIPAAWSVPWVLGVALASGRRLPGLPLLAAGAGGMAVLILVLGYPASAVGVPGDGRSNLDPPSLFAVALAAAQIGIFLQLRRAATNGRLVQAVNRAALPVYLLHQSVLVAAAALFAGRPYGLVSAPDHPSWIALRLAWLPFLALVLAAVTMPRWRTTRRAPAD